MEGGITVYPARSAGESALWVDPAEIPSDDDVSKLGLALAAGMHGDRPPCCRAVWLVALRRRVIVLPGCRPGGGRVRGVAGGLWLEVAGWPGSA